MKFAGQSAVRVGRSFFARSTTLVARDLIGLVLAHDTDAGLAAGVIVEVEAYLAGDDAASHAFRGRTQRNGAMFGPAGSAYVYFIYGVHHCFNVVTGETGSGQAVLVRALEPIEGLDVMRSRRGRNAVRDLCRGPGKVTQALAIGRDLDGADLVRGPLGIWRRSGPVERHEIAIGPRIGITKSADLPLRFSVADSRYVSGATTPRTRSARRA